MAEMTLRLFWEPGSWHVTVEEVSANVYEIVAVSPTAGEIRLTTTDPDAGLEQCRKEATERTGALPQ
jgi:hypothetical protein